MWSRPHWLPSILGRMPARTGTILCKCVAGSGPQIDPWRLIRGVPIQLSRQILKLGDTSPLWGHTRVRITFCRNQLVTSITTPHLVYVMSVSVLQSIATLNNGLMETVTSWFHTMWNCISGIGDLIMVARICYHHCCNNLSIGIRKLQHIWNSGGGAQCTSIFHNHVWTSSSRKLNPQENWSLFFLQTSVCESCDANQRGFHEMDVNHPNIV